MQFVETERVRERERSENWIRFIARLVLWFSDIAGGGTRAVLISLSKLIIEGSQAVGELKCVAVSDDFLGVQSGTILS